MNMSHDRSFFNFIYEFYEFLFTKLTNKLIAIQINYS